MFFPWRSVYYKRYWCVHYIMCTLHHVYITSDLKPCTQQCCNMVCSIYVDVFGLQTLGRLQRCLHVASKAYIRCAVLLKGFHTSDVSTLVHAFVVFIQPILEYCSPVPWLLKDIKCIEKSSEEPDFLFQGKDIIEHRIVLIMLVDLFCFSLVP